MNFQLSQMFQPSSSFSEGKNVSSVSSKLKIPMPCHGCPLNLEVSPLHSPRNSADLAYPKYQCTPDYDRYFCQHDGICFIQENIHGTFTPYCKCKPGFYGNNCEYLYIPEAYEVSANQPVVYGRMDVHLILAAVGVLSIATLLLMVSIFFYLRRQNKTLPSMHSSSESPTSPATIQIHTPRATINGMFSPNQDAHCESNESKSGRTVVELCSPTRSEFVVRRKSPKRSFVFADVNNNSVADRTSYYSIRERLNGEVDL